MASDAPDCPCLVEARPRNLAAEENHFVEDLLLFAGLDERIAAVT
jgi:hypothetical protein